MLSNLKGWRTIIFGAAIAALGAIQAADIAQVIPNEWVGVVMSVIGAVIMILRSMTDSSIGKSE